MPALRELQAAVREALLGGDARPAAAAVEGDGLASEARLDLYRHHVLTTLTAVLAAAFPAVVRLVDPRFFAYAAGAYVRADPPRGPCLFEYGATFPDFLAAFPPCRGLPYLADVARLEWALHVALHAQDAEPLDPARLAAVAPEDMPRLAFALDPSVAHLASPWPVDRIWRANQVDGGGSVDLGTGSVRLEVRRLGDAATMRALAPADHAFRAALAGGLVLEDAAAAALAADPAFDLAGALAALFEERILAGFAVSNRHEQDDPSERRLPS